MKAFLMAALCLAFAAPVLAQTSDTDPATKDDVILYLRTMHSHDMIQRTLEAMLKPMHQMFHDQFQKDHKSLPADFEAKFNKMIDETIKGMPIDEMTQASVPVYQKHFTRGDIEKLNSFYASPTGQKVLEEMPAVTGDSMQAMMPIMRKYLDEAKERMQRQIKEMEESQSKTDSSSDSNVRP